MNMMKQKLKILSALIIIIVGSLGAYYFIGLSAPINNKETQMITINSGSTLENVADILIEHKLIKNKNIFLLYIKLNSIKAQAGTYQFYNNDGIPKIAKKINDGRVYDVSYTITFIEGKTVNNYGVMYADKTDQNLGDVLKVLNDKNYLVTLIDKYWFLTANILDSRIYYPLEGYLFPDTYNFNNDAPLKTIVDSQLKNFEKKIAPYKQYIIDNNLNVHDIITLASIIEKEANTPSDRLLVSGVFTNRINSNMSLGSDVTTYYAEQVEMGSVTDLNKSQYNALNNYNTRNINFIGLPVGPICNPSISSIEAAIYPKDTKNMYFYADKSGNVHFATTLYEHNVNINKYGGE